MITVGSTVARRGDRSGRTRVVKLLNTDADGKTFALLDAFLDGWLVWKTDDLVVVKSGKRSHDVLRKDKPHARRSLFSRRA